MSYDILDAWLDEKAREPFDFELWELGDLSLRTEFETAYFRTFDDHRLPTTVRHLHLLLVNTFGTFGSRDITRLAAALDAAKQTVVCAMEQAEDAAYCAFSAGESLHSIIGNGPLGTEEPAEVLIQSLDAVGPPEGFAESALCAALGLWIFVEWAARAEAGSLLKEFDDWAQGEMVLLLAEANWYRGKDDAGRERNAALSERNKVAADTRHLPNRENKKRARTWYLTAGCKLGTKAAAAREIAQKHNIVFDVAKRWVSDFERSNTRPGPPQKR